MKWNRRNELLAVLPGVRPLEKPPRLGVWSALIKELSREWRVFTAYAPRKGVNLPVGGSGLDALPLETLHLMRRALAEQLVSGVVIVGHDAVFEHIELLHSYSPHLPFVVALDGVGRIEPDRLEILLGWADFVLLSDPALLKRLEPFLRRSGVPAEVVPEPGQKELWGPFVDSLSRRIQRRFLELAQSKRESSFDWIAFLGEDSWQRWGAALLEWRACLPREGGVFLVPRAARKQWRGRIKRHWRDARVIGHSGDEDAVARANDVLSRSRRARALLLSPWARLSTVCLERMSAAAIHHPLSAAVRAERVDGRDGEDFRKWSAFSHAWQLRFRGGYRADREVYPHCLLIERAVVAQSGFLDPRLGWNSPCWTWACASARTAGSSSSRRTPSSLISPRRSAPIPIGSAIEAFSCANGRWIRCPCSTATPARPGDEPQAEGPRPGAVGPVPAGRRLAQGLDGLPEPLRSL